ncbi:predicted protein [Lichtheimia corymbifera JMRC:FSU:9682]|uniref:BZIP domain-containing protein n=1 Tax=Lichtheimia corymbifera JMRC:FSU:9682 TaxID=1263082 RepID=A0A068RJ85_9FUNG|nr:predicted protein [Lichtheimia corymbifera JMRC:FSU:9682]
MSSLESLLFGNAVDNEKSEREAAEELDLWSNAQFTFDIKPETTSACQDETKSQQQQQSRSLDDVLDAATYEKLVNYLDYELPLQQQQQQQQHQQQPETFDNQQPSSSSSSNNAIAPPPVYQPTTTTTTINNNNANTTTTTPRRPLLLPKPAPLDPLQFAASFIQQPSLPQHLSIAPPPPPPSTPIMTPTSSSSGRKKTTGTKRTASAAIESEKKTEEQIAAEEDKRRRNTAASARFRIKKKQREQAMEQTVREMKAKSDQLQERVVELEQEVKWLRGLLLEK